MIDLFGHSWNKENIIESVSSMDQIAGIRPCRFDEGFERDVQFLMMYTGTGLNWNVLTSRGMDIGLTQFRGIPLSWISGTGEKHPAYYEPFGMGWLRSFSGGLMVTCGLTYVGSPSVENSEPLGLHGRISNIPAKSVQWNTYWDNDHYYLEVKGKLRETSPFGPNLLLERTIRSELGSNMICIEDVVTNEGYRESPHMILYHINLGFPIVSGYSHLSIPCRDIDTRDEASKAGLKNWSELHNPVAEDMDYVFYPDVIADQEGTVKVSVFNPKLLNGKGLGLALTYQKTELPCFTLWKSLSKGRYVLGLEPGNCRVGGRALEEKRGTLKILKPGERVSYKLKLEVIKGGV